MNQAIKARGRKRLEKRWRENLSIFIDTAIMIPTTSISVFSFPPPTSASQQVESWKPFNCHAIRPCKNAEYATEPGSGHEAEDTSIATDYCTFRAVLRSMMAFGSRAKIDSVVVMMMIRMMIN